MSDVIREGDSVELTAFFRREAAKDVALSADLPRMAGTGVVTGHSFAPLSGLWFLVRWPDGLQTALRQKHLRKAQEAKQAATEAQATGAAREEGQARRSRGRTGGETQR
jgi:hypothetical protein